VDRLLKQIATFMSDIADEFKIVVVEAIRSLCLKFPAKHRALMNFLSNVLREVPDVFFQCCCKSQPQTRPRSMQHCMMLSPLSCNGSTSVWHLTGLKCLTFDLSVNTAGRRLRVQEGNRGLDPHPDPRDPSRQGGGPRASVRVHRGAHMSYCSCSPHLTGCPPHHRRLAVNTNIGLVLLTPFVGYPSLETLVLLPVSAIWLSISIVWLGCPSIF
jgi:hypothetical protein